MLQEEVLNIITELLVQLRTNRVLVIKIVFLIAMMLIGHHRGLVRLWPVRIPVAHGLNQILGALAGLAVGIIILCLVQSI